MQAETTIIFSRVQEDGENKKKMTQQIAFGDRNQRLSSTISYLQYLRSNAKKYALKKASNMHFSAAQFLHPIDSFMSKRYFSSSLVVATYSGEARAYSE